jgi:hypothetical protein
MSDIYKSVQSPIHWWVEKFQGWYPDLSQMRLFSPKNLSTIALATQVVLGTEVEKSRSAFDVLKYVDPLIGTSEGGKN